MRQRSRLVVLALAALVGLASCTGSPANEEPTAVQSLESSPSSPASEVEVSEPEEPEGDVPTPEPLPLPEYPEDLTAEDTAENAILAAEYFLDLMNYSQSSGDVEPFQKVALEQCKACERFINLQVERYESGGYLRGNDVTIMDMHARRSESGAAWEIASVWEVSEGTKREDSASKPVKVKGRNEKMRVAVALVQDGWKLVEIAFG